jgi:hypothetical protein
LRKDVVGGGCAFENLTHAHPREAGVGAE